MNDETVNDLEFSFTDEWEELEYLFANTETATGSSLVVNALYLQNQELHSTNAELKTISALLLILVVFEILRIVRSWSKGIGVK